MGKKIDLQYASKDTLEEAKRKVWYSTEETPKGTVRWRHWKMACRDEDKPEDDPQAYLIIDMKEPIKLNGQKLRWYNEAELKRMSPEERKAIAI